MASSAPTPPPPSVSPPISLFVRGKGNRAKQVVVGPPVGVDASVSCAPIDMLAEYNSADGTFLAVVEATGVRVIKSDGGAEVFSVRRPQITALALSPLGTFLLTWERLQEGDDAGNLRVWRVATGELLCHWQQKVLGEKAQWPAIKWSNDEELAFRLVTNTVHIFDGRNPTSQPVHTLRIEGIAQCSLEPTGAPHHVATFVPEKKGAPAQLRLWKHGDYGEGRFLSSKSFFKADQVAMLWNPKGGSMLVHTHTDVDTTGKSYMGETGLYYLPLGGNKKVQNVTLRKDGPIHDVQWSPLGNEFICIFGTSPPEACIFNLQCEITYSFGEAPRNTVSWSPHGRFLALAGFGNMSGELSFYDRKALKCLGTVDAHMTVNYGWSPCSRYFLTAILFPRLRVDNGYRVWSLAGGLLHQEKLEEQTIAAWRPLPSSLFPAPDDATLKSLPAAVAGPAPTSKAAKYVPPGQRAGASTAPSGRGLSLADLAAATGGGGPGFAGVYDPHKSAPAGRSLSQMAAAMESGGSAALRGPPPGSETVGADPAAARNAAKNKAKREAAKKKKEEEASGGATPAAPTPPPPAASATDDGDMTEEKLTKKLRAAEKKMRQIVELKELRAGGKPLEKNQLDKIENEAATKAELEDLTGKMAALKAGGGDKWR